MKPLSEWTASYRKVGNLEIFEKGKQFLVYKDGYRVGFITQHDVRFFVLSLHGKSMQFYNIVDFRRYLIDNCTDYFYTGAIFNG